MSKTEALILRARVLEELAILEADIAGRKARAHNRPREGVLVPKAIAADPMLLAQFQTGWDKVDEKLAA